MTFWQRLRRRLSADVLMWALSATAVLFVVWQLHRAGVLNYHGTPLDLDALARLGGFLAGASAPVGIGWVARTFYLQRQQLNASIEAIREQMTQARDQYDRDHTPNFNVQICTGSAKTLAARQIRSITVYTTNHGAPSAPTMTSLMCFGADGAKFAGGTQVRNPAVTFAETVSDMHPEAPVWSGGLGVLQVVEVDGAGAANRRIHQIFGAITQHDGDGTSVVLPEIDDAERQKLMDIVTRGGVAPRV